MHKDILHLFSDTIKNFETIYFRKGDSQTDESSVFIAYRQGYFVAATYTQSKEFKTLKGAIVRMARKGYVK